MANSLFRTIRPCRPEFAPAAIDAPFALIGTPEFTEKKGFLLRHLFDLSNFSLKGWYFRNHQ